MLRVSMLLIVSADGTGRACAGMPNSSGLCPAEIASSLASAWRGRSQLDALAPARRAIVDDRVAQECAESWRRMCRRTAAADAKLTVVAAIIATVRHGRLRKDSTTCNWSSGIKLSWEVKSAWARPKVDRDAYATTTSPSEVSALRNR